MKFTKDDLKDGMVCTMRDGGVYVKIGGRLRNTDDTAAYSYSYLKEYTEEFLRRGKEGEDLVKITYGGKIVFEREEWRELTIDEAFELLKSGPVRGEGGEIIRGEDDVDRVEDYVIEWRSMDLRSISPYSEGPYRTVGFSANKFRIKK